jgi:hypothetical protein
MAERAEALTLGLADTLGATALAYAVAIDWLPPLCLFPAAFFAFFATVHAVRVALLYPRSGEEGR